MTIRLCAAAALGVLGVLGASPAGANPLKSLYTTIELRACKQMRTGPDGRAWLCPGLKGYPVYIADGDLRMFVSVGTEPEKRRAATQTLGAFNTLFTPKTNRATLEWRFVRRNGQVLPYATIQRFFTKDDTRSGEVLVVTKVTASEDCHVAHIDALDNADAIALARSIADGQARGFDCSLAPRKVGRAGKSPM